MSDDWLKDYEPVSNREYGHYADNILSDFDKSVAHEASKLDPVSTFLMKNTAKTAEIGSRVASYNPLIAVSDWLFAEEGEGVADELEQSANEWNQFRKNISAGEASKDFEDDFVPGLVEKTLRGASEQLPTMALGAAVGPAAFVADAGLSEFSDQKAEGKGFGEAATQGLKSAAVVGLFNKFAPGLQSRFGKEGGIRAIERGFREAMKRVPKEVSQEVLEETVDAAAGLAVENAFGKDISNWSEYDWSNHFKDTILQSLVLTGGMEATQQIQSSKYLRENNFGEEGALGTDEGVASWVDNNRELAESLQGVDSLSRRQWKELGMPATNSENRNGFLDRVKRTFESENRIAEQDDLEQMRVEEAAKQERLNRFQTGDVIYDSNGQPNKVRHVDDQGNVSAMNKSGKIINGVVENFYATERDYEQDQRRQLDESNQSEILRLQDEKRALAEETIQGSIEGSPEVGIGEGQQIEPIVQPEPQQETITTEQPAVDPEPTEAPSQAAPSPDPQIMQETVETPQGAPLEPTGPMDAPAQIQGAVLDPIAPVARTISQFLPKTLTQRLNPKDINAWLKRYWTSAGGRTEAINEAERKKVGAVAKHSGRAKNFTKDLKAATNEAYGREVNNQERDQMIAALQGDKQALADLPREIRNVLVDMGDHRDKMSKMIRDLGFVGADLELTIEENEGKYLNRAYRVFEEAQTWKREVPPQIFEKAVEWIKGYDPNLTEEQAIGRANEILNWGTRKGDGAGTSDISKPRFGQGPSQDVLERAAESFQEFDPTATPQQIRDSLAVWGPDAENVLSKLKGRVSDSDFKKLQKATEIPQPIRDLMGEYKDPSLNYLRTINKMASAIEGFKMYDQVVREGMGTIFLDKPTTNDQGDFSYQIQPDGNPALEPFKDVYMTEDMKNAIEDIAKPSAFKDGVFAKFYRSVAVFNKKAKTVYNPITHARNFFGNPVFLLTNGNNPFKNVGQWSVLRNNKKETREFYEELLEQRIIDSDITLSEVREMGSLTDPDLDALFTDQKMTNQVKRKAKGFLDAIDKIYAGEDSFWKISGYVQEKTRLEETFPEWTPEQVKTEASRIISETMPTYDKVSKGMKYVSKNSFLGSFVSFMAENWRTSYATLKQAVKELKDPRTKRKGLTRIFGMAATSSMPYIGAAATAWLNGYDEEEQEAIDEFSPHWNEGPKFYLPKGDDGKGSYFSLNYIFPRTAITGSMWELLRGDPEKALEKGFGPAIEMDMTAKTMVELASNVDDKGRPISNPVESTEKQWADKGAYLLKSLKPGVLGTIDRNYKALAGIEESYGKTYDPLTEAVATLTGQRAYGVDPSNSLSFLAREYSSSSQNAKSILNKSVYRGGNVDPQEIAEAYASTNEIRKKQFEDFSKTVQAGKTLGLNNDQIISSLKRAGVSKEDAENLVQGIYIPERISKRKVQYLLNSSAKDVEGRLKALRAEEDKAFEDAGMTKELERMRRDEIASSAISIGEPVKSTGLSEKSKKEYQSALNYLKAMNVSISEADAALRYKLSKPDKNGKYKRQSTIDRQARDFTARYGSTLAKPGK